ncbi:amidase [Pyxidicoccus fallax]|uniref:Amidase n=1 Tax=Pyxidicoccus fallax TaxID=394095 RepID=A0A848LQS6_9BACT|nr:amidase [Pyxidicoccus fallax]NMO20126.1 amidase [Pyxidicoccus fallax]NPC80833.1 amidase [Pyxidicoccus fallax]
MDPFVSLDATAQAELVRRREVTPLELVDAAIARIERHNPKLNAVVHTQFDTARLRAKNALPQGPFTGVPFLLKDLLTAQEGYPLTGGSRLSKDFVPDHDSELVKRHLRAGLVVLGKTNTPELGLLPTTESALLGPCRNPWNLERSPGGSSGGAAAAVASGMVPFAHASDGGGSIRIPASSCGLFGLKPTRGRNPTGPELMDPYHWLVAEHAVTRSVRDSAALLDATEGPDVGAPYIAPPKARPYAMEVGAPPGRLRIGLTLRNPVGAPVHPECLTAVAATARLLEGLGHSVLEGSLEAPGDESIGQHFMMLWAAGVVHGVDRLAQRTGGAPSPDVLEPFTRALYAFGQGQGLSAYLLAQAELQRYSRVIARRFEDVDVWLLPTVTEPPTPLGTFAPPPDEPLAPLFRAAAFTPYCPLANITGNPAMSVPLHWSPEGLPVGVQFIARFGDEATLFRLAAQLEAAHPWTHRRPAVFG